MQHENKNIYGYIYITTNKLNGKIYIGQRKGKYNSKYYGSGKYIRRALDKYGIENFENHIIEWCDSKEHQDEREKYWIAKYNCINNEIGYNISTGGVWGGIKGLNEEELKEMKIKISKKSKKHWQEMSYEQKHKLSLIRSKIHKGKSLSKETKDKISQSQKIRIKINGNGMQNKKHKDDSKKLMKQAWKTRKENGFNNEHLNKATIVTLPTGEVIKFNKRKEAYDFLIKKYNITIGLCKNIYKSKKAYEPYFKKQECLRGLKIE